MKFRTFAMAALVMNASATTIMDKLEQQIEARIQAKIDKIEKRIDKKVAKIMEKIANDIDHEIDDVDTDEIARQIEQYGYDWI